jgi:hypothetical protein
MVTDLRTRVEKRRRVLIELCAMRPHDTLELMHASGLPRDTVKNDLTYLCKANQIVQVGRIARLRRGGSHVALWSVPGVDVPARRLPLPVHPVKTRWVTFNPYNPEPVTP